MKILHIYVAILISLAGITACESQTERERREAREEQQRIEHEENRRKEEEAKARRLENVRIAREARLEKERREKAIYDRYINNSLYTGAVPYDYCFGSDNSCYSQYCSEIVVITPRSSDVVVTIKKYGEVYRHAYIRASSRYTFKLPDGTYQPFFYYGKGWNPDKVMKQTSCGTLEGGFVANEHFGKDDRRSLSNNILTYELILQQGGNFSTQPSNPDEAF